MADGGRVGAEMIEIRRPARVLAPLVLDSPHSGTVYPEDFDPLQPPSRYRRAEDMYVDELFSAAPDLGMPLLAARFGRIYCDVNRAFDDLAPETLADGDELVLAPSAKARLGKGVVWTATPPDGAPLLASALPRSDYEARLERCWRPYHAALADLLAETRGAAGGVYHLDLHSMQPVANAMHEDETGGLRPDMVLSDREGRSCSAGFIAEARRILLDLGFSVAINDPFKGRRSCAGMEIRTRVSTACRSRSIALSTWTSRALKDGGFFEHAGAFDPVPARAARLGRSTLDPHFHLATVEFWTRTGQESAICRARSARAPAPGSRKRP
ncbi:MAG: N-formylglutamate amidohydrolase [Alphaproteobacteria bacterium]|nr:N-formylglutamate amidohydrolase [Alphaproteobacteria bacterium]